MQTSLQNSESSPKIDDTLDKIFLSSMLKGIPALFTEVSIQPNFEQLYDLAEKQQGYFTAHQAKECGYSRQLHVYHATTGDWIRKTRGIFRLKFFPISSPYPEGFYVTQLWTQNRDGEAEGVFGYGTALYLHNLGTYLPKRYDVIVPKHFRRNSEPPGTSRFYRRTLQPYQFEMKNCLQVTTKLWTIVDLLVTEQIDYDYILDSLKDAVDRFDIRVSTIKNAPLDHAQKEKLLAALKRIKYRGLDEIQ